MSLIESQTKQRGRIAPNFDLLGTDGERYTLKDFLFNRGVLVTFTCNHCPYAKAARSPLIELSYAHPDIAFVAISSNDPDYEPADSYENMQLLVNKYGIPFPYLFDETQNVAKSYDAQCTPDNYLFKNNNGTFELFYHGRINDNRKDASLVTQHDLADHCERLIREEQPAQTQPPSMGCSIKRKQ